MNAEVCEARRRCQKVTWMDISCHFSSASNAKPVLHFHQNSHCVENSAFGSEIRRLFCA